MIVSSGLLMIVKVLTMFTKKIIALMTLEAMMLLTILAFSMDYLNTSSSQFIMIMMTIFMVLDSTMGISILISSSRNSNSKMMKLNVI